MNSIYRLMGAAAVCVAASLSLSASAETPAGDTAGAAASSQAPIPTLHCEFKAMSACAPDGDCKEGAEVAGIKVDSRTLQALSAPELYTVHIEAGRTPAQYEQWLAATLTAAVLR